MGGLLADIQEEKGISEFKQTTIKCMLMFSETIGQRFCTYKSSTSWFFMRDGNV